MKSKVCFQTYGTEDTNKAKKCIESKRRFILNDIWVTRLK